jgi:hypothetical protein
MTQMVFPVTSVGNPVKQNSIVVNSQTRLLQYSPMTDPYLCEHCGTYMTYEDIAHTVEIGNYAPKYFCSLLCYCEGPDDSYLVDDPIVLQPYHIL